MWTVSSSWSLLKSVTGQKNVLSLFLLLLLLFSCRRGNFLLFFSLKNTQRVSHTDSGSVWNWPIGAVKSAHRPRPPAGRQICQPIGGQDEDRGQRAGSFQPQLNSSRVKWVHENICNMQTLRSFYCVFTHIYNVWTFLMSFYFIVKFSLIVFFLLTWNCHILFILILMPQQTNCSLLEKKQLYCF